MNSRQESLPGRPERWRVDAGGGDIATLVIAPDAQRTRRFEIDCRMQLAAAGEDAHHAMRVEVDGALEWSRSATTRNIGQADSIDYHFRREVPPGRPLRIVVRTEVHRAQRLKLLVEAEEA